MSVLERDVPLGPLPVRQVGTAFAAGRLSTLHAFGRDTVVKLYPVSMPLAEIEAERDLGMAVERSGLAVPAVQPRLVSTPDGRVGIVLERVDGPLLHEAIGERPLRVFQVARQLADLHRRVHAVAGLPGLPRQDEILARKIGTCTDLDLGERRRLLAMLEALPAGHALCHGDFHAANVVASARGPVILDWVDACTGNALGDVARSWVVMRFVDGSRAYRTACRVIGALTLRARLRDSAIDRREFARWQLVCAAARLREGVPPPVRAQLLGFVRARLRRP